MWENDRPVQYADGNPLPTLVLQPLVPKVLLDRFRELMLREAFVPCEAHLPVLTEMKWTAWKERIAIERLQRKAAAVLQNLQKANNHWEEVFWWMLAANFGIKVNAANFEAIAKTIPINVLAKHKDQIHQLEGLLLGQAGLLNATFAEDYPKMLQREYRFYKQKYQLTPLLITPFFLRMRPANFPTVRLAQLAMLIHTSSHLFSKIKEAATIDIAKELFAITANDYWHYHYKFDEPGTYHPKQLGNQMIENILINTVVPVLFAYGVYHRDEQVKDKAITWLGSLDAEKNTITQKWMANGVSCRSALESQALLELKSTYCNQRRCLDCAVGNTLLAAK